MFETSSLSSEFCSAPMKEGSDRLPRSLSDSNETALDTQTCTLLASTGVRATAWDWFRTGCRKAVMR